MTKDELQLYLDLAGQMLKYGMGLIAFLLSSIIAIIIYIWKDAKRVEIKKEEKTEKNFSELGVSIKEVAVSFSDYRTKIDGKIETIEDTLTEHKEKIGELQRKTLGSF